jgi:hypothetical protein
MKMDILKKFKSYCPKCGSKIDYGPVKEKIGQGRQKELLF